MHCRQLTRRDTTLATSSGPTIPSQIQLVVTVRRTTFAPCPNEVMHWIKEKA